MSKEEMNNDLAVLLCVQRRPPGEFNKNLSFEGSLSSNIHCFTN